MNAGARRSSAVIALATLVMALIQVGAIVAVRRVARAGAADARRRCSSDVRPLIAKAHAIADEASKTATIATAQAAKIDRLVTDLTRRVDETSVVVQQAIITPAREGMAIVAAIKAALGALRGVPAHRPASRPAAEEEDPLFIG